jgi:[methyl-Co(III) methanol-specific corrinoid protein]:coenzyme M methyltransferase
LLKTMRQQILDLLSGKKVDSPPAFSGLIHVTAEGLQSEGLVFHQVHKDARKMAKAAASAFKLSGLPSAALPLDMYVEAEALGAEINFREDMEFEFPLVRKAAFKSVKEIAAETAKTAEVLKKGRIKLVCDAIRLLKEDVGSDAVISGVIPGPYTLLLLAVEAGRMFVEMKKEPAAVTEALDYLSSLLAQVGVDYRDAGADFITVHDMGGSPAFIGPDKYERFALPAEKRLLEMLPKPRVLSVCGNVTPSLALLAQAGADAVSIDQTVELAAARMALKDTLLFGSLDPVATLYRGDEAGVAESVVRAKRAGVDAVWPGCDLIVQTPIQNLKAMKSA